ncbi:hypothetical protein J6590_018956, partial [Homalodisca vitripennis]
MWKIKVKSTKQSRREPWARINVQTGKEVSESESHQSAQARARLAGGHIRFVNSALLLFDTLYRSHKQVGATEFSAHNIAMLQFTFLLVQHLESDTVTKLTPGSNISMMRLQAGGQPTREFILSEEQEMSYNNKNSFLLYISLFLYKFPKSSLLEDDVWQQQTLMVMMRSKAASSQHKSSLCQRHKGETIDDVRQHQCINGKAPGWQAAHKGLIVSEQQPTTRLVVTQQQVESSPIVIRYPSLLYPQITAVSQQQDSNAKVVSGVLPKARLIFSEPQVSCNKAIVILTLAIDHCACSQRVSSHSAFRVALKLRFMNGEFAAWRAANTRCQHQVSCNKAIVILTLAIDHCACRQRVSSRSAFRVALKLRFMNGEFAAWRAANTRCQHQVSCNKAVVILTLVIDHCACSQRVSSRSAFRVAVKLRFMNGEFAAWRAANTRCQHQVSCNKAIVILTLVIDHCACSQRVSSRSAFRVAVKLRFMNGEFAAWRAANTRCQHQVSCNKAVVILTLVIDHCACSQRVSSRSAFRVAVKLRFMNGEFAAWRAANTRCQHQVSCKGCHLNFGHRS